MVSPPALTSVIYDVVARRHPSHHLHSAMPTRLGYARELVRRLLPSDAGAGMGRDRGLVGSAGHIDHDWDVVHPLG